MVHWPTVSKLRVNRIYRGPVPVMFDKLRNKPLHSFITQLSRPVPYTSTVHIHFNIRNPLCFVKMLPMHTIKDNQATTTRLRDLPGLALMGITSMYFRLLVEVDSDAIPDLSTVLVGANSRVLTDGQI